MGNKMACEKWKVVKKWILDYQYLSSRWEKRKTKKVRKIPKTGRESKTQQRSRKQGKKVLREKWGSTIWTTL